MYRETRDTVLSMIEPGERPIRRSVLYDAGQMVVLVEVVDVVVAG